MNPIQDVSCMPRENKTVLIRRFTRMAVGIPLALLLSGSAFAQYGGGSMGGGRMGGGSATPSYGGGKAVGIGVGTAAAGAGVLYLALHHRSSVNGCVRAINDRLSLFDEKTGQTYSLLSGSTDVKSGERVELSGKRSKDAEGTQTFQVKRVVKNLGACNGGFVLSTAHPASQ
jgi:hypothetical protein